MTNGDLSDLPPTGLGEPGPGLIQVGVGVKGFELSGDDDATTFTESTAMVLDTAAPDEESSIDGSTSQIDKTDWQPTTAQPWPVQNCSENRPDRAIQSPMPSSPTWRRACWMVCSRTD